MYAYEDENRGLFQSERYAKQLVSFEGLRFQGRSARANVTPTDIDGYIQLDKENCFIFFELKHSGEVADGQSNALTKMVDALNSGGAESVLYIAVHETKAPQVIKAKDAKVKKLYWRKKWKTYKEPNKTLYECIRDYLKYLEDKWTK